MVFRSIWRFVQDFASLKILSSLKALKAETAPPCCSDYGREKLTMTSMTERVTTRASKMLN
jgi:hypothetical protein